jgi:Xaa-Pro dipeptidase
MSQPAEATRTPEAPFDTGRLDTLMDEAGLDALLATSGHNTRYLLGGYRFPFFAAMQAIGHSQYLPVVIYARRDLERAAYIGNAMEEQEHALRPFWTPTFANTSWTTVQAAEAAVRHLSGMEATTIGIEPSFLPSDAHAVLARGLPSVRLMDATGTLERLRAVKTPSEISLLREASELITDAMLATIAWAGAGTTKAEIIERLRREEVNRGLDFEYCLLTMGRSYSRVSSEDAWRPGDILSMDSGGNNRGYIGDICRMGILGEPDAELVDLLGEIEAIQQAAFSVIRAGALGGAVLEHGRELLRSRPIADFTGFAAHGMGLISHEAPFLMTGRLYDGVDADRPLEAGMVLSVETTMVHPERGFIKLEDTVAVTPDGCELLGDRGRGWNRGGG